MLTILTGLIIARPKSLVLLAACLAVSGSVLSLETLRLDADTNSLIGDQRPFMQTYRQYLDRFGDLEAIYVVVDAGENLDAQGAREAVDGLDEMLRNHPALRSVRSRITTEEQWIMSAHSMPMSRLDDLLASDAAIKSVLETDDPGALAFEANELLTDTITGGESGSEQGAVSFTNACFLLQSLTSDGSADSLGSKPAAVYLTSSTGRMHFLEIMPEKNFESFEVIEEPLRAIRSAIDETSARFPGLDIGLTGKPVLQADELATSASDMTRGTVLALIAISILFILYFRECRRPLLALIAFMIAFGWTYGAATLIVGRLNLLSMVFMLVLVGAGIDYGIHVIARWRESRRFQGSSDSVGQVMRTAVTGNLTGAATSAGVFFLALTTGFQGLRELGIIAGMGLIFCALSMAIVLPALLRMTEDDVPSGIRKASPTVGRLEKARSGKIGRTVLALALASAIPAGLITYERLEFESNLLDLQSKDLPSVRWEKALFEDDSSGSWFGAIIVEDLDEVPSVLELARKQQEIGPIRSALDFVAPPTEARTLALERLAALDTDLTTPPSIRETAQPKAVKDVLRKAARNLQTIVTLAGETIPAPERETLDSLRSRLAELLELDPIALTSHVEASLQTSRRHLAWLIEGADQSIRTVLPEAVRARFSAEDGGHAVLLQPKENIWEPAAMDAFVSALRTVSPDATGVPITQYESIREMHHAFLVMAWGAIIVVGLGIWLDFRSFGKTMACLLTLALAILWTLGGMASFGISINLANFFAIPILIGLGADSCIHVVHRWKMIRSGEEEDFGETLKAVTLTACTTGIGFGMLIFAHHQGLQSLGWIMVLGSASVLVASTIVLPTGLRLISSTKN